MHTVCIIGAGQLGSRHLQGLKRSSYPLDIWVVDASEESLKIAESRFRQVESEVDHRIHFEKTVDSLPYNIDICIVATGSKPRAKIIEDLLSHHKVTYLILEKFLFPVLEEYEMVSKLIKKHNVQVYVNCPRRMYQSYGYIKSILDSSLPIKMIVKGSDWGLCCNAIHFIDIFMKLCEAVSFDVDTTGLIPKIKESKRKGYIEMNGSLEIHTPGDNHLSLISYSPEKECEFSIQITNGDHNIVLNESTGVLKDGEKLINVKTPYQSELTGVLVETLINGGEAHLTEYETSKEYHLNILKALLEYYSQITGTEETLLPIT